MHYGNRITKNNTKYFYDNNGNLAAEITGSVRTDYLYDHTGMFAMKRGDVTYYYRKNPQGDITALLDSYGNIVVQYKYNAWGGTHYALQSAGKMAIRTNIDNLVNNPLDEFVKVGPKDGGVSGYIRSISRTGDYGQIFANKLQNGMYQIADGHHRVAVLRRLGYKYVKFFLLR